MRSAPEIHRWAPGVRATAPHFASRDFNRSLGTEVNEAVACYRTRHPRVSS